MYINEFLNLYALNDIKTDEIDRFKRVIFNTILRIIEI